MVRTYEQEQSTTVRQQKRQDQVTQEVKSQIDATQQKLQSAKDVNEYQSIYESLSSDMKKYFTSPSELKTRTSERTKEALSKVEQEIQQAKDKKRGAVQEYFSQKRKYQRLYSGERLKQK